MWGFPWCGGRVIKQFQAGEPLGDGTGSQTGNTCAEASSIEGAVATTRCLYAYHRQQLTDPMPQH